MSYNGVDGEVSVMPGIKVLERFTGVLRLVDVSMLDFIEREQTTVTLGQKIIGDRVDAPIVFYEKLKLSAGGLGVDFFARSNLDSSTVKKVKSVVRGVDDYYSDWHSWDKGSYSGNSEEVLFHLVWLSKENLNQTWRLNNGGDLVLTLQVDMFLSDYKPLIISDEKPKFLERPNTWNYVQAIAKTSHLTDFTLRAKDSTEVRCHKLVLAAGSKVFQNMFEACNNDGKEKELVLDEMTGEALEALVDYLYGRRVMLTSDSVAQELNSAFDKYDIGDTDGLVSQLRGYLANAK